MYGRIEKRARTFIRDQEGQVMIEYVMLGLMLTVIAVSLFRA